MQPSVPSLDETDGPFMLQGYVPPTNVYDEAVQPQGELRGHYRDFYRRLQTLGTDEFQRRWAQLQQTLHENGIAFGAYGDPQDHPRPWELDALPLLIPQSEWDELAEGLDQRARLLDHILVDLYGEQKLLRDGLLPPQFLYAHPGFRRPYHGQPTTHGGHLAMYAADLARSPDGKWWIVADRTEAPSGAGYALENRIVIAKMLPNIYQQSHVQRVAHYFLALQDTLRNAAPRQRDNPRIVLLSQGPTSDNFFEDAYLARYLGYTLVEGADLAVRNNRVVVKTLGGLLPVDVILRRPNSEDCDPLELNPHAPFGIAGLLQAVRSGNVAVVNSLGSGLLESPLLMAFMPRLCQALLSQPLKIPGVATWWCGEPDSLNRVIKNIESLTIMRAFRQRGRELEVSRQIARMTTAERIKLISDNPADYVAQEQVRQSTAPVWTSKGVASGNPIALRTYLARSGSSYIAMPGGLARVSSGSEPLDQSLRSGERSKDTWVIAQGPVNPVTLLNPTTQEIRLKRSGAELPSRVADNLFWLGRHLERADAAARLLRTLATKLTDETGAAITPEVHVLLRVLAEAGQIEPGYVVAEMSDPLPAIDRTLAVAALDEEQPGSLRAIVSDMFRVASLVRDRMSIDSWRIIRRIHQQYHPPRFRAVDLTDLVAMTNNMIVDLAAFGGLVMGSMTRTLAFRFLDLGRRIEQALQTLALLQSTLCGGDEVRPQVLETLLEVADSLMTYRSRYLANMQLAAVLDLLLTDETNPRSVAFQLVALSEHVQQLPRERTQASYSAEQRHAMALLHSVRMTDVKEVAELHSLGDVEHLQRILVSLEARLPKLSETVSHRYLIHAGLPQQLSEIQMELVHA